MESLLLSQYWCEPHESNEIQLPTYGCFLIQWEIEIVENEAEIAHLADNGKLGSSYNFQARRWISI